MHEDYVDGNRYEEDHDEGDDGYDLKDYDEGGEKGENDNCLHGSLSHHNPGQAHSEVTAGA